MYDTGIADRLRAAGLNVVEIAGWQTRGIGTGFDPEGSLDHHTAGSRSGNAPSLTICIYGRSDLPGPLCHVLIGRDNTCYVIAAGKANHAGAGYWLGLDSNYDLWGIERENVGTTAEPWRPDQTDVAARAHAALMLGSDSRDPDHVARHAEYALPPGRKPDTHSVHGPTLRAMVRDHLTKDGGPVPKPERYPLEEDDMPYIIASVHVGNHFVDGSGASPIYTQAQIDELVAQKVPVVTMHNGSKEEVLNTVRLRFAGTDEELRGFAAGASLYLASISQIEGREEQRDLADVAPE